MVPRDAVGQLLKCCWALVPAVEKPFAEMGAPCDDDACGRGASGPGKRAEAEAIARAVLGRSKRMRDGERGEGGGGEKSAKSGLGLRVCTREGEALLAVVEFLKGGGGMEVSPFVCSSKRRADLGSGVVCSIKQHVCKVTFSQDVGVANAAHR